MNIDRQRNSFLITAAYFYGFLGLICSVERNDELFGFYSITLGIYSCLYHYHDELRFFWEDFVCSFFLKLHLFTNYIFWLSWGEIFFYLFLSDILGYIIFYISVKSWNYKHHNCGYSVSHNIWHIYTGGLSFFAGMTEKRVDIGYWNGIFFGLFICFMMINKVYYKYNILK